MLSTNVVWQRPKPADPVALRAETRLDETACVQHAGIFGDDLYPAQAMLAVATMTETIGVFKSPRREQLHPPIAGQLVQLIRVVILVSKQRVGLAGFELFEHVAGRGLFAHAEVLDALGPAITE